MEYYQISKAQLDKLATAFEEKDLLAVKHLFYRMYFKPIPNKKTRVIKKCRSKVW